MVVLDTNIIIDHLRKSTRQDSLLMNIARRKPKEVLAISTITIQELYEGKSTQDHRKEQLMLATIAPLKILPYTFEVAQHAGVIARDLKRPIELADAAVAATAIMNNATLFTLNIKDFSEIADLTLE